MRPIDTNAALAHLSATVTGIQRGLEKYKDVRILSLFERTANLLSTEEEEKRNRLLDDINRCLNDFVFRVSAELQGNLYNPPITEPKQYSTKYPYKHSYYESNDYNEDTVYREETILVDYYAKSQYPFLGLWVSDPVFSWNYLTGTDFQASLSSSSFQYNPSSSRGIMHYFLIMMQIGYLLPNTYGYQEELKNSIQEKLGSLIALLYGCEKIDKEELSPFCRQILRDAEKIYAFESEGHTKIERRIGSSDEIEFIRWLSGRPLIRESAPRGAPAPVSSPYPALGGK